MSDLTLTVEEKEAISLLLRIQKAGEEPRVANWILRCLGLLAPCQAAIQKLGWLDDETT